MRSPNLQLKLKYRSITVTARFGCESISQTRPIRRLIFRFWICAPGAEPCACRLIGVNGSEPRWARLDTGSASALQWVNPRGQPANLACQISIGLSQISVPVTETTVQTG